MPPPSNSAPPCGRISETLNLPDGILSIPIAARWDAVRIADPQMARSLTPSQRERRQRSHGLN